MNDLAQWWQDRAPRERALLLFGGVVMLASLIFLGLLEPLAEHNQQQEKALRAQNANLQWLESQRHLVEAGRPARPLPAAAGRSVLAVLNEAASAQGVAGQLKRVTPASDNRVMLTFEAVPYANYMRWLAALETQRGARVARIVLEKTTVPGQVNVGVALVFP
ncbi:MAG: type II secretion system protein M [Gammaproteobacteria bacterium]|nr:type II secretion system protein M [Gammaproteobacteria bacterium]